MKETISYNGNDLVCESVDRRDQKDIPKKDKMPSKGKKPVKDISKKPVEKVRQDEKDMKTKSVNKGDKTEFSRY